MDRKKHWTGARAVVYPARIAPTNKGPHPPMARPTAADPRLRPHLMEDETVRWQGAPSALGLVRASLREALTGLFLAGFGLLVWSGVLQTHEVAFGWQAVRTAFASEETRYLTFAGTFVLPWGLWHSFAPLRAWRAAGDTVYAVTDRRAIVLGASGRAESFGPGQIHNVRVAPRPGGYDVLFHDTTDKLPAMWKKHFTMNPLKGFHGIAEGDAAARALARIA